jgi:Lon protease-like protein
VSDALPRPFHPAFEALPAQLAIFPLPGVLLLPDGKLPLNIFEPRYLALVSDALANGRMFGMIQPNGDMAEDGSAPVFDTGCAGRISSLDETEDGRFLVTLTGVSRFRVVREIEPLRGYRRVEADWRPFRLDLEEPPPIDIDRERLIGALKAFSRVNSLDFNWKAIERIGDYDLSVSLCMACPLEPREKQALLECPEPMTRTETLITLMEMAVAERHSGGGQVRQ